MRPLDQLVAERLDLQRDTLEKAGNLFGASPAVLGKGLRSRDQSAVNLNGYRLIKVRPDDFTLQPGDEISITIEPIGTLVNVVE